LVSGRTALTIVGMVFGLLAARRPVLARRGRSVLLATAGGGLAAVVFASSALADTDSVRFEYGENGTWTVPDRVTEIEVEVAGAGGGGSGTSSGGSGALVEAVVGVAGGMVFDVGVGGGGGAKLPGGGNAPLAGGGGASIVESGDILIIAGGGGGTTYWNDASAGSAGRWLNGDGLSGGPAPYGGIRANAGTGGTLAGGVNGEDYDPSSGLFGRGGQTGRQATVGGAGGEGRSETSGTDGGGGGGAGFGGGSSGKENVANLRGGGGAGGSVARGSGVSMVDGAASFYSMAGGAGGSGNGASGTDGWVVITWVIPPPLPDPDVPTSATSVEREPVVLTLTMPAGLACSAPTSDASGTWIQLPAANECNDDASNTGRSGEADELLGWATTPDFPTDIAQRQVDNGWGAYELFDESGALSAVFIPAGGWTQASSDTSLFPIWGQVRG
jgi:hypothetical protein